MDDDGITVSQPSQSGCVTVKGDGMTIDLTEVARQVRGFYNSGITTGHACAQVAYKCLTSPTDYPINDGSFRSLTAIVPPGRVIRATRPAPMRWWLTSPMTIANTVFKALAPRSPIASLPGIMRTSWWRSSTASIEDVGILHRQFRSAGEGGAPSAARTASPAPSPSMTATPTTAPTSRSRRNSPSWSSAMRLVRIRRRRPPSRRPRRRAGGAGTHPCHRQHPDRARPLPSLGARRRRRRQG